MATVTGKTSEKIDELIGLGVTSGQLDASGQLTLTTRSGTVINAGSVSNSIVGAIINSAKHLILTNRQGSTIDAGSVGVDPQPITAWPIGSVYMGVTPTNPNLLLGGGTWVAWGRGRVVVGVDPADADFDAVEETGGTKSKTLTEDNLPPHSHAHPHTHPHPHTHDPALSTDNFLVTSPGGTPNRANGSNFNASGQGSTGQPSTPNTGPPNEPNTGLGSGMSAPFNILQPFITCYMWKRTA